MVSVLTTITPQKFQQLESKSLILFHQLVHKKRFVRKNIIENVFGYLQNDLLEFLNQDYRTMSEDLTLPACPPRENLHNHWTFCRIFSQEIHTVLEKHFNEYEGKYLSKMLVGEVFYERVTFADEGIIFDPSVLFQAVSLVLNVYFVETQNPPSVGIK